MMDKTDQLGKIQKISDCLLRITEIQIALSGAHPRLCRFRSETVSAMYIA
jgi:hypothetical protein